MIQCSTLSFSAYVVAAVPIIVEVQTTPAPTTTLAVAAPAATPAPVKVRQMKATRRAATLHIFDYRTFLSTVFCRFAGVCWPRAEFAQS